MGNTYGFLTNRDDMQQPPRNSTARSSRTRRTQPALPGVTLPTTPIAAEPQWYDAKRQRWQQPPKKRSSSRRAGWRLFLAGLLLAMLYLALYPLLAGSTHNNAVSQLLPGAFPWLPRLYWTNWAPVVVDMVSRLPLFNMRSTPGPSAGVNGFANLLLCLLGVSFLILLLAARAGRRLTRETGGTGERGQGPRLSSIYVIVFFFALLFAALFVFAPGGLYTDVFLYGLYGRIIAVYHANPYLVSSQVFSGDLLHAFLPTTVPTSPAYGPLWIDMSIPVALFAHESVVNVLLGFRLLAVVFHLTNALLLWAVLAKLKPEMRVMGTLLYAWNPLVLLLGVSEMHAEIVVITFLLLGAFFWQRRSLLLGWCCILLATLLYPFCVLLLPLFLRLFVRDTRGLSGTRTGFAWLGLLVFSVVIVVLAYAPYWPGLGFMGILGDLRQNFVQNAAQHSLGAAFSKMPFASLPGLTWLTAPYTWLILAAAVVGLLLLLGTWLTDSLEFALLFASWIFLALFLFLPTNWPWYVLIPLALALGSGGWRTILLSMLLTCGATLEYYFGLWTTPWIAQGLVIVGLPLLLWGWILFFTSTWDMTHRKETGQNNLVKPLKGAGFSRVTWPSRPSWPGGWRR